MDCGGPFSSIAMIPAFHVFMNTYQAFALTMAAPGSGLEATLMFVSTFSFIQPALRFAHRMVSALRSYNVSGRRMKIVCGV